jgi:hypothetical protein
MTTRRSGEVWGTEWVVGTIIPHNSFSRLSLSCLVSGVWVSIQLWGAGLTYRCQGMHDMKW